MSNDPPQTIENEPLLEEWLSQPSEAAVASLVRVPGDVIVLGAGGKMGPSLTRMLWRATQQGGVPRQVFAASRFSNQQVRQRLVEQGIETIACDLTKDDAWASLPEVPNVFLMTGYKFGTQTDPSMTWATNVLLTAEVFRRYRHSRIVVFSSGNLYSMVTPESGGSVENDSANPVGEYAMTTLGRERMVEYCSKQFDICAALIRLNYAVELRYGVLLDLARQVYEDRVIDLTMGYVNVIWQGDANAMAIASLADANCPPYILNVAGPEILKVKNVCQRFGEYFKKQVQFSGEEGELAYLNNGAAGHLSYGKPRISAERLIEWVAAWTARGGLTYDKPTHFQVQDGKY